MDEVKSAFTFKPVPRAAYDFHFPPPAESTSTAIGTSLVRAVRSSAVLSAKERRSLLVRYRKLPLELKVKIWAEMMVKPGLHFFAVRVPQKGGVSHWVNDDGVAKLVLLPPTHRIRKFGYPYTGYFPKGKDSAYINWLKLAGNDPVTRELMMMAMITPLVVFSSNQGDVWIDAATDVVYLKFQHKRRLDFSNSTFLPYPAFWMQALDHTALRGIRHVALEFERLTECIFWPGGNHLCVFCGRVSGVHSQAATSKILAVADFLHCFADLETVHAVFNKVKQGPVDPRRDEHYTVSGFADPKGLLDNTRWKASPGKLATPFYPHLRFPAALPEPRESTGRLSPGKANNLDL